MTNDPLNDVDRLLGEAVRNHEAGHLDAAESRYRRVLELDSRDADAAHLLGTLLGQKGSHCEQSGNAHAALELYDEAARVDPGNALALLAKGLVLAQFGEEKAAAAAFRNAIRVQPELVEAHFQLAHLRSEPLTDAEIAGMEGLFESRNMEELDQGLLAFGLGRAHGKRDEFAAEFEWLERAHEIMAEIEPFDIATYSRRIDSVVGTFSPALLQSADGNGGSDLVFVVGMPRSGTTLVDQILASHPQVCASGELMTGNKAVRSVRGAGSIDRIGAAARHELAASLRMSLPKLLDVDSVLVDTTPSNFQHVGIIAWMFPGARFVHCTRHPLDTCLSIRQHPLSKANAYAHQESDLVKYYGCYRQIMAHWHSVLPGRIHDLSYEALVESIDNEVRSLLDFCGLEFDPACLEFHKTKRAVATPSASQVKQPLYASSVGRWKNYGEQLQPLKITLESVLAESLD